MPLVQGDAAFLDDAGNDARLCGTGTDGADTALASCGDLINFRAHPGRGEECVFSPVHGRAAGMRGLSVKGDRMPFNTERAEHCAQRQIQIQQHRSLLDVQFQISGRVFEFLAAFFHPFEINPNFLQRVWQADVLFVLQFARLVHIEVAGAGR